ncbi:hypothetical protein B0H17DRAFT_1135996 [Mycena rosella]|uniref:Uncharacterized protein n=1 Tax=Mycena rosella TaxID=1033263 RepID=A0AAD7DBK9_MYCRO|nr:hypothetical protein B0H17DRAFT_1135996 [Mycena rosella]
MATGHVLDADTFAENTIDLLRPALVRCEYLYIYAPGFEQTDALIPLLYHIKANHVRTLMLDVERPDSEFGPRGNTVPHLFNGDMPNLRQYVELRTQNTAVILVRQIRACKTANKTEKRWQVEQYCSLRFRGRGGEGKATVGDLGEILWVTDRDINAGDDRRLRCFGLAVQEKITSIPRLAYRAREVQWGITLLNSTRELKVEAGSEVGAEANRDVVQRHVEEDVNVKDEHLSHSQPRTVKKTSTKCCTSNALQGCLAMKASSVKSRRGKGDYCRIFERNGGHGAPDSTAFAANIGGGGQFDVGEQTQNELCEYHPTVETQNLKLHVKMEIHDESLSNIFGRGRENRVPLTPSRKRIKTEGHENSPPPAFPSGAALHDTRWELAMQSQQNAMRWQIEKLWEKIHDLEQQNRSYRAQAEGHLAEEFYPLVQRMGELEGSVNHVNEQIRPLLGPVVGVTSASNHEAGLEDIELLVGIRQPAEF